ncbi:MAG: hypothetical protein AB7P76_11150 [Candidatus Melainabacteria bacterium]
MNFLVAVAAKQVTTLGFGQDFVPRHIRQDSGIERQLLVFGASVMEYHHLGMESPLASFTDATLFGNQLGA